MSVIQMVTDLFFRAGIKMNLANICPVTAEEENSVVQSDLKWSDLSLEFVRNKIGKELIIYINKIDDKAESQVRQRTYKQGGS